MTLPHFNGVDYSWARPDPTGLYDAGVRWVARYVSESEVIRNGVEKNLSLDEAQTLTRAGLHILTNYEYATRGPSHGATQAEHDLGIALPQHKQFGGPDWAPIMFSVDFDVPDYAPSLSNVPENAEAKLGPIADYFRKIKDTIGLERTGAYGGYWVIKRLFDAKLISVGWQTYAWSGGHWDGRAQFRQIKNGVVLAGGEVDLGLSFDNYTKYCWKVGNVTPAPSPTPTPSTSNWEDQLIMSLPVLKRGAHGQKVKNMQSLLNAHGWRLREDGVFGPKTEYALKHFQVSHHTRNSVRNGVGDGICGRYSWADLLD